MSIARPSRLQLIEKELWGGRLSEIQRIRPDCHSETLQFIRDLRQLISAAGDQNQIVMIAGEELGEFISDAAGGAGDQDGRHSWFFWCQSSPVANDRASP